MAHLVRVWDAPTRLFHWTLALCVVALVVTAEIGGSAMEWHFRLGYAVMGLLLFRMVWGLVGGHWSRFNSFVYHPRHIIAYIQGKAEPQHVVGHNPMGALSVFALLGFLALQIASGLFSDDEIAATGPLAAMVSSAWVANATYYHKEIGKFILIVLVTLHVLTIGFYLLKKDENLVRPMITGDKELHFSALPSEDSTPSRVKGAVVLVVCSAAVWGFVRWAG